MQHVPDVDIKEAMKIAEEELQASRVRRVANAIRDVSNRLEASRIREAKAEAELAKTRDSVAKQEALLERIKGGDWSAIPEPKESE